MNTSLAKLEEQQHIKPFVGMPPKPTTISNNPANNHLSAWKPLFDKCSKLLKTSSLSFKPAQNQLRTKQHFQF